MIKKYYPYEYAESVFMIDYQKLYQKGFRGIIFDIDNTLVHHGDDSTPEIDDLFRKIQGLGLKTLLLSNNDRGRVERFIKNIDTPYICDADKPNPQNYLKAVEMLNIKKEEAVVIGDQVFTDILGANRSGLASILVRFIRQDDEKWIGKRQHKPAETVCKRGSSDRSICMRKRRRKPQQKLRRRPSVQHHHW